MSPPPEPAEAGSATAAAVETIAVRATAAAHSPVVRAYRTGQIRAACQTAIPLSGSDCAAAGKRPHQGQQQQGDSEGADDRRAGWEVDLERQEDAQGGDY